MTYLFLLLFTIFSPTDSTKIKVEAKNSIKIELAQKMTDSTEIKTDSRINLKVNPKNPTNFLSKEKSKKEHDENTITLSTVNKLEIQKQDSLTLINLLSVTEQLANLPADHKTQNELTLSLTGDLLHPDFLQTKVPVDSKGLEEQYYGMKTLSYYWVTHLPKRLKKENLILKSPTSANPIQSVQLLI